MVVFSCKEAHVTCLDCFRSYAVIRLRERQFVLDNEHGYTVACPAGCPDSFIDESHHFKLLTAEQVKFFSSVLKLCSLISLSKVMKFILRKICTTCMIMGNVSLLGFLRLIFGIFKDKWLKDNFSRLFAKVFPFQKLQFSPCGSDRKFYEICFIVNLKRNNNSRNFMYNQ